MKLYAKSTPEQFERFKDMSKDYEIRQFESFTVENTETGEKCTREVLFVMPTMADDITHEHAEDIEFVPDVKIYTFKLGRRL